MRIHMTKYALELEALHNIIYIVFQIIKSVAVCLCQKCTRIFNRTLKNVKRHFWLYKGHKLLNTNFS